ncbi:MAG: patatin-like phospholipase family protein [Sciscionella sp.]
MAVPPDSVPAGSGADFLVGDSDVLRTLVRRRDAGSRPGARTDDHRIALVVGGGGMRGAYTAGMAHALEEAGLCDSFDEAYGCSAGAYVAAAFITGQAWAVPGIFHEDMASREFIDPRRIGTGRPVVSLDYLLDHVLTVAKPLEWRGLLENVAPMRVIATAADDLRSHVLEGFQSIAEWKLALRATANIPLLAGPPVGLDGRNWIDGSVSEPLPVLRATSAGATHVLALVSRSRGETRPPRRAGRVPLWVRGVDTVVPGLGAMAAAGRQHSTHLRLLGGTGNGRLMAIMPLRTSGIGALSTDAPRVRWAAALGHASAMAALRAVER